VDHIIELLGLGHQRPVAFRVGYYRPEPVSHQFKENAIAPDRDYVMGKLDKNIRAAAKGWRGSINTYLSDYIVIHSQLTPQPDYRTASKLLVDLGDPSLEETRIMGGVYSVKRMRRSDHTRNAVRSRCLAHPDGLIQGWGAVINSPEYVAVNICHHDRA